MVDKLPPNLVNCQFAPLYDGYFLLIKLHPVGIDGEEYSFTCELRYLDLTKMECTRLDSLGPSKGKFCHCSVDLADRQKFAIEAWTPFEPGRQINKLVYLYTGSVVDQKLNLNCQMVNSRFVGCGSGTQLTGKFLL
jgi:hypothetical protein